MAKFGTKVRRITGVATAAAAASMIGLTTFGAGATPVMAATVITQAKAKTAALNHAKVASNKAYDVDIDLERGKKVTYYDVEFKANGYEYDYEINASNATVIRSSKKALKTTAAKKTTTASTTAKKTTTTAAKVTYIGNAKAKTIALNHAKVAASKVTNVKIELDKDKGVVYYEVDFKSGNYEYEYDINATTGKIIKSQKKTIKKATASKVSNVTVTKPAATTTNSNIGAAKAKNIALNHAKVSAANVRGLKAELDRERGIYVYEVEFRSGRYEYDYTINATTGKVISFDKEYDD